jgi:hypothetical protein
MSFIGRTLRQIAYLNLLGWTEREVHETFKAGRKLYKLRNNIPLLHEYMSKQINQHKIK